MFLPLFPIEQRIVSVRWFITSSNEFTLACVFVSRRRRFHIDTLCVAWELIPLLALRAGEGYTQLNQYVTQISRMAGSIWQPAPLTKKHLRNKLHFQKRKITVNTCKGEGIFCWPHNRPHSLFSLVTRTCAGGQHSLPRSASWQYLRVNSPGGTCSGMLAIQDISNKLTFWPWKWCLSQVWRGLPLCQF